MRKVIVIIAGLVAMWLAVRFITGGPEDTWICDSGRWIADGHPSTPQPQTPCN